MYARIDEYGRLFIMRGIGTNWILQECRPGGFVRHDDEDHPEFEPCSHHCPAFQTEFNGLADTSAVVLGCFGNGKSVRYDVVRDDREAMFRACLKEKKQNERSE